MLEVLKCTVLYNNTGWTKSPTAAVGIGWCFSARWFYNPLFQTRKWGENWRQNSAGPLKRQSGCPWQRWSGLCQFWATSVLGLLWAQRNVGGVLEMVPQLRMNGCPPKTLPLLSATFSGFLPYAQKSGREPELQMLQIQTVSHSILHVSSSTNLCRHVIQLGCRFCRSVRCGGLSFELHYGHTDSLWLALGLTVVQPHLGCRSLCLPGDQRCAAKLELGYKQRNVPQQRKKYSVQTHCKHNSLLCRKTFDRNLFSY